MLTVKNTFLHVSEFESQTNRPRCASDMTDMRLALDRLTSTQQAWEEFTSELATVQESVPPTPRTPDFTPRAAGSWREEGEECPRTRPATPREPYYHPNTLGFHQTSMQAGRPAGMQASFRQGGMQAAYPKRYPAAYPYPAEYQVQEVPAHRERKNRGPANAEITSALEDDVTIMLRNIPNKYTQELLLEHLQKYTPYIDFFYLPIDFKKSCNLGYAFVNFTSGRAADQFTAEFDGGRLSSFRKSPKVLAVQRARVQGVDANVKKFRSSAIMGSLSDAFKPLLFKNGRQIEFPKPEGALPPIGTRYQRTPQTRIMR